MVLIRELEQRVVAVQIGHWECDAIEKWRFEEDPNERQRIMRLREGDGIDTITTMLKHEYNISDVETCLKLTFRWPLWMLLVDDGTTRPQSIKTDNDMDLFLSMKVDVADLILFVTTKNDAGVVTESPTLSNNAGSSSQPQSATLIHEDYVIVDLASSDSDVDSGHSSRPDPWNERLDGLMSKKISNLEVGSSSIVPTYANEENTFFGVDLSMGVFGRDEAPVLDSNIDGENTVVNQAIDDATYEGDDIFVGRVYKNMEDFKFKWPSMHFKGSSIFVTPAQIRKWSSSTVLPTAVPGGSRSNYHKQASARVVGEFMRPQYMGAGSGPPHPNRVPILYWKAWRARGIAMDGARGSVGNIYSLLPTYLHALKAANPKIFIPPIEESSPPPTLTAAKLPITTKYSLTVHATLISVTSIAGVFLSAGIAKATAAGSNVPKRDIKRYKDALHLYKLVDVPYLAGFFMYYVFPRATKLCVLFVWVAYLIINQFFNFVGRERPIPWNERLDGLMSKKIYNLEVGSSSIVPTYANEENTFFGVDLSMGVFGRDEAPVLDSNIDGENTVVNQAIDDATYEGDDIFVGRVYKNMEDFKFKWPSMHFKGSSIFVTPAQIRKWSSSTVLPTAVPGGSRSNYHKQASARVVGEFMRPQYMGAGSGPPHPNRVPILYWKAWRARGIAMDGARGSVGNIYSLLPTYLHALKAANPKIFIPPIEESSPPPTLTAAKLPITFEYLFFALAASINGLKFMRKVFPNAAHAACVVHLQRNISSIFKAKTLSFLVSRAARAYRIANFHLVFGEICRVSPEYGAYLKSIGFDHWARSYFVGERYNVMTSNVVEFLNAVLKEAREFPIVYIVEFVRKTLMSWFAIRRETAKQENTMLTPKLAVRSCTCKEFNLLKIPCPHAIDAAIVDQVPMHSLVDVHYTSCYWVMTYKDSINPLPALSSLYGLPEDIASMNFLPPHTKRAPRRPKKKRFFSRGEFQKKGLRGQNVCSRCKAKGHNRATCCMPI
ncbi:unnamed protein product [Arabidopsis arenosa]|uniref:SWIM-type domain-containing protein n=1 Tax=Arabidopsis arenosa TaxID=38785 RepID=A0A8S2B834_ARAAE|nr:unnamed protein product [Arabidopsis arenosa]